MNTSRNTPAHVAEELDRLGVSDEGIEMNPQAVEGAYEGAGPCNICGYGWPYHADACAYKQVARQLEQVEAERDRYREALEMALDCRGPFEGTVSRRGGVPAICTKCEALIRAALHPKERDDG